MMERHVELGRIFPTLAWLAVGWISLIAMTVFAEEKSSTRQPPHSLSATLSIVERMYAVAYQLEQAKNPNCVDHYYQTAIRTWPTVQEMASLPVVTSQQAQAWTFYHKALTRLLVTAQQYNRWHPRQGLMIASPARLETVPCRYNGFSWKPDHFSQLIPVELDYDLDEKKSARKSGNGLAHSLTHHYRSDGLGVSLVVKRPESTAVRFLPHEVPFAATAV